MERNTETTYDRMRQVMSERWPRRWPTRESVPQKEVGKLAGVSQPSAYKWAHGGLISHGVIVDMAVKLGVSVEWLETGRGHKYPQHGDLMFESLWAAYFSLDELQRMELVRYAEYLRSASQGLAG